jgi:uncharacterized protein (TIGR02266 family)
MPSSVPPEGRPNPVEASTSAWPVDCDDDDTFLFASISNIAKMGIFVRTHKPLDIGTQLALTFPEENGCEFLLMGTVEWVNQWRVFGENRNPGMGVLFENLRPEERERVVAIVRTIVYLRESPRFN